jgi:hypothetical protein
MPLPNKFLLGDIFKLYSNTKIKLDKVIINVNCKTSFLYIHIDLLLIDDHLCGADGEGHHQQAQDQGEREKEPYVCPRTLYTSALFGMMEGNDEGIDWVSICKCMLYLHPHTNDSFSYGHCWLSNEEATCCPLQDGPRSSP